MKGCCLLGSNNQNLIWENISYMVKYLINWTRKIKIDDQLLGI